jgi:hypothetical protein
MYALASARHQNTQTEETIIQKDESKGWVPSKPIFSPDGKRLAVYWNRHSPGLWIVSLEPYAETFLQPQMMPFGWSPKGKTGVRGTANRIPTRNRDDWGRKSERGCFDSNFAGRCCPAWWVWWVSWAPQLKP